MSILSVCLLTVLGLLCLTGIVSQHYRDNWLQFLGLAGVLVWSLGRAWVIFERGHVSGYQLLSHVSIVLFALGTAVKVWRHR